MQQDDEAQIFFRGLPSLWLEPGTSNLQHLTLFANPYWGYYPKFSLQGVHFPNLKTLSLGKHCFVDDSQLDWTLSHGSTLTKLHFSDCTILFEMVIMNVAKTYLDQDQYVPNSHNSGDFIASYDKR